VFTGLDGQNAKTGLAGSAELIPSSGGKTPAATVYAAILREMQKKGDAPASAPRGAFTYEWQQQPGK